MNTEMQSHTIQIIQPCNKRNKMKCWESFYIQIFQRQNTLISEQEANNLNPLHTVTNVTRRHDTQFSTHHPRTQVTSAQGNYILQHNSNSVYILSTHKLLNIFNFILFIAEYPNVHTAT